MNPLFSDHNFEILRRRMFALRHNFFDNMDKYLLDLENVLNSRGINVLWGKNSDTITDAIQNIINTNSLKRVCLDCYLPSANDLSKCTVVANSDAESSTDDIDMLVIDADFAVCDTGSLVFLNSNSKNNFNKVKNLVVIVNIDQVIASIEDLSLFISLRNKDAQREFPDDIKIVQEKPKYISLSSSVYAADNMISQQDVSMSVILSLDNLKYMTNMEYILSSEELIPSLYCIHCGKCLEVCPVAQASDSKMSPIEVIKMNVLDEHNRSQHLFKSTTLCGACDDVCPVKIPLSKLLLTEMQISNMAVRPSRPKELYSLFQKRSKINKVNNSFLKFFFIKRFFGRNKMLSKYYSDNSADFFNISFTPPHEDNPNEILKDSDFE